MMPTQVSAAQAARRIEELERRLADVEAQTGQLPARWAGAGGGGTGLVLGRLKTSSPYNSTTNLYSVYKWDGSAWDDNSSSYYMMQVPNQPTSDDESLFDGDDLVLMVSLDASWPAAASPGTAQFDSDADYIAVSTVPWAGFA